MCLSVYTKDLHILINTLYALVQPKKAISIQRLIAVAKTLNLIIYREINENSNDSFLIVNIFNDRR